MLTWEERLRNLTETLGTPEELEFVRKVIRDHRWNVAKTYAEFCPHGYSVREWWKDDDVYQILVHHIWKYGMDAYYGKQGAKRYWFDHEGGWYYFIVEQDTDQDGCATKECELINRGRIMNYDFWVDNDLFGSVVRCRVKKPSSLWHPEDIAFKEEAKAKRLEDKKNA